MYSSLSCNTTVVVVHVVVVAAAAALTVNKQKKTYKKIVESCNVSAVENNWK